MARLALFVLLLPPAGSFAAVVPPVGRIHVHPTHLEKAQNHFYSRRYKEARDLIEHAAHRGNPTALYLMGRIYYEGNSDIPKDRKLALTLLTESADKGDHPMAQYFLAVYVYSGDKDKDKKKYWARRSAYNKVPYLDGILYYGYHLYNEGSHKEALAVFERAGETGKPSGLRQLTEIYSHGAVAEYLHNGSNYTEYDADWPRVIKLLEILAGKGDPYAFYWLGSIYKEGLGDIKPDPRQAYTYLLLSKDISGAEHLEDPMIEELETALGADAKGRAVLNEGSQAAERIRQDLSKRDLWDPDSEWFDPEGS